MRFYNIEMKGRLTSNVNFQVVDMCSSISGFPTAQFNNTGAAQGSYGVFGCSDNEAGAAGNSTFCHGVYGLTCTSSNDSAGVFGDGGTDGHGVIGFSCDWTGIYGNSCTYIGIHGHSPACVGVHATSDTGIALSAVSQQSGGIAGYFRNCATDGYAMCVLSDIGCGMCIDTAKAALRICGGCTSFMYNCGSSGFAMQFYGPGGLYSIGCGASGYGICGHGSGTGAVGVIATSLTGNALEAKTQCSGIHSLYVESWCGNTACFKKTQQDGYVMFVCGNNTSYNMPGICICSSGAGIISNSTRCHGVIGCSCTNLMSGGSFYSTTYSAGYGNTTANNPLIGGLYGCGFAATANGVIGQSCGSGTGVLGDAVGTGVGVCGSSNSSWAVSGNTAYNNSSSRYLKHLSGICLSKCLKERPLKVYRYYWEDSNNKSFSETIGPMAEDFDNTFNLGHGESNEDYSTLWSVDGAALGLAIENTQDIDTLKEIVSQLYSCIQKLEGE